MTTITTTMIQTLAEAMVELDRESGDCSPEALRDPEATACEWDGLGIESLAADLGLALDFDRDLDSIRSAYATAWREAVALEAEERTEDAWWAWHDADQSRWHWSAEEAEDACAAWVSGASDEGPTEGGA